MSVYHVSGLFWLCSLLLMWLFVPEYSRCILFFGIRCLFLDGWWLLCSLSSSVFSITSPLLFYKPLFLLFLLVCFLPHYGLEFSWYIYILTVCYWTGDVIIMEIMEIWLLHGIMLMFARVPYIIALFGICLLLEWSSFISFFLPSFLCGVCSALLNLECSDVMFI